MKKFINIIIGIVLLIMSIMNCILVRDLEDKTLELIELTDVEPEIIFIDSFDTVYITKTEIVKLPIYNTDTILINDTLVAVERDSVFVEIPISTYHYDTTLAETHISLICEGFDVRLDTLLVERIKMPTIEQKVPKKWCDNFGIGVGLSGVYMEGFKLVPSVGIYYTLFSL